MNEKDDFPFGNVSRFVQKVRQEYLHRASVSSSSQEQLFFLLQNVMASFLFVRLPTDRQTNACKTIVALVSHKHAYGRNNNALAIRKWKHKC